MHHDNFDNFDSAHNPWNSVNTGPKKDICALWQQKLKNTICPSVYPNTWVLPYTWLSASHGCDKTGPYAGIPYDGGRPGEPETYRDNDSELLVIGEDNHWLTKNPNTRRTGLTASKTSSINSNPICFTRIANARLGCRTFHCRALV